MTEQTVTPFIGGRHVQSDSDLEVEVINPSNGKHLLSIPAGSEVDADRAVAAARRTFESGKWSQAPASFRQARLHRLADLIAAESGKLDALDATEMGKPVSTGAFSAARAADLMRFNAEAVGKITGDAYSSDEHSLVLQRLMPRGVVAAIVPWNFPTYNAVLKIAPALAAGNTVVLKPSELSSRSADHLGNLALQAGIPEGVLNVVPGLGETVGKALGLHMDVDMVAFTGSTLVGKLMLRYAGESNMKVVQAECGGKSPQIVFGDGVDIDQASAWISDFLLTNQGQICSVGSRLLVHRSIEEAVIERVTARAKQVVIGDAQDPKTTFGPIASAEQCARVMRYIVDAQRDGNRLVIGGRQTREESGGYFIEPTVFRNVSPSAQIAQEEVFGPVLAVIPFEDESQAIAIANGTKYGLAAYVWTADLSRGLRMAKAIRSTTLVNAIPPQGEGAGHAASWEPVGFSGVGVEGGMPGMRNYMRHHLIAFNHG